MIIQKKTSHKVYHSKPAQRLEIYYELMIIIILVPAALFIGALLWLTKKSKSYQTKPSALV